MGEATSEPAVILSAADHAAAIMRREQELSVQRRLAMEAMQKSGPEVVTTDEMGVHDPMLDISPNVEYLYYKCDTCKAMCFAAPGDTALVTECPCTTGRMTDRKDREGNQRPEHGIRKLYKYSRPRVAADRVEKQIVTEPDLPKSVVGKDDAPAPGKVV